MKFAASLTVAGLFSFLVLEIAKMLVAPIVAWIIGMLAIALQFALIALGLGLAIGIGIYFYRRSKQEPAEV